jgi:ATP-dependent DNA helicase PIF1
MLRSKFDPQHALVGCFGMGDYYDDDDDDTEFNPEIFTVVISHIDGQIFVAKFHKDAVVPITFAAYNPETAEYKFKVIEAEAVESELIKSGFNIFKTFSSYEEVSPVVHDQADPVARDDALECVRRNKDVFVTGGAACGKTEFLRKCVVALGVGVRIAVCSMTGVAAQVLDARLRDVLGPDQKVTTLHRLLSLRPDDWKLDIDNVTRRVVSCMKRDKKLPPEIAMIDEVSMCSAKMWVVVVRVLRAMNPDVQIIATGDFLQLPPVRKDGDPECLGQYAFESSGWESVFGHRQFLFEGNYRLQGASARVTRFQEMLERVRVGTITDDDIELLERDHDSEPTDAHYMVYPRLADANRHNQKRLDALTTRKHTFESHAVSYESRGECNVAVDEIPPTLDTVVTSRLKKEFTPVQVAVGARVMLTRNHLLDTNNVANGSTGVVTNMSDAGATVLFDGTDDPLLITPTVVDVLDAGVGMDKVHRTVNIVQLPLRLAWAGTIHLVQGRGINRMHVSFASSDDGRSSAVFAPGQAYVALSRAVDLDGFLCSGACSLKDAMSVSPVALKYYNETLKVKAALRKSARDAGYTGPDDMANEHLGVPYDRRDTKKEMAVKRPYLNSTITENTQQKKHEYRELKKQRRRVENVIAEQQLLQQHSSNN